MSPQPSDVFHHIFPPHCLVGAHRLAFEPGQRGSTKAKGYPAPVFLWDFKTRTSLFVFQGLTEVRTRRFALGDVVRLTVRM